MAKKWADVTASPEFQSLTPSDKESARQQYFNQVVAPQVPRDALEQARSQFDNETAQGAFATAEMSGDEARSRAAGDTRATMRPQDIEYAYDTAAARGDRPESQAMSRAYVQRERADSPIMTGINDRMRTFARGVPVLGGIADEVNAGFAALTGGNYQKALDYERAKDATFDELHPKESMALQFGGGLASGVGIAGAVAPALSGFSRAAALGTGFGGGAVAGAADGYTRGEGTTDRFNQALLGGAIGGGVGAAAPVIAKGVGTGINALVDMLSTNKSIRGMGMDRPSADVLSRVLQSDGSFGSQGAARIRAAGPDAMIADAGPSAAGLLDTAIQRSGPAASAGIKAIEERAGRAAQNVTGALDTHLGMPVGVTSEQAAIRDATAAARRSAYKAAYDTPIDYAAPEARRVQELLQRVPANVIAEANSLMKLKGEQSAQIMAKIADNGAVTYERLPDVRQLDYITRALRQVASTSEGTGALGAQTPKGAALEALAGKIRGSMRELVPLYGRALDTAADPIERRQALLFGEKLLSRGVTRDEVEATVAGYSKAEREAAKQGIRAQIDEAVSNVKKTQTDPNMDARQAIAALRDLSSDAARQKISAVIGDDGAKAMFGKLDEAARAFELRAATATNSKTFARQATDEIVSDMTEPGALSTLAQGSPVKAGRALLQTLMANGPEAQVARKDAIYGNVVSALTQARGPQAETLLKALEEAYRKKGSASVASSALGTLLSGAASGGTYRAIDLGTRER